MKRYIFNSIEEITIEVVSGILTENPKLRNIKEEHIGKFERASDDFDYNYIINDYIVNVSNFTDGIVRVNVLMNAIEEFDKLFIAMEFARKVELIMKSF
jgi:hypothetical protein